MSRIVLRAAAAVAALLVASCSSLPLPGTTSHGPVAVLGVDQANAAAAISKYRASRGLPPVVLDAALQHVAQKQAEVMAGADQLSHEVDGALPRRLARSGADRSAAIENISAGYATLDSAILGWKRSPHHNENLLFPPMRRMGIAAASAPRTRYKTFWSLVMTN